MFVFEVKAVMLMKQKGGRADEQLFLHDRTCAIVTFRGATQMLQQFLRSEEQAAFLDRLSQPGVSRSDLAWAVAHKLSATLGGFRLSPALQDAAVSSPLRLIARTRCA